MLEMPAGTVPGSVWAVGAAVFVLGAALAVGLRPGWVTARPRAWLAALVGVSALAVAVLVQPDPPGLRLEIDPSTEPLLPASDPAYDFYRTAVLDFGDDEVFVVAIECEAVFGVPCLSALRRIHERVARLTGVRSVRSLVGVTSFRYAPEDEWVDVGPFIEEIPESPEALAALQARALADPVYRRSLVSDDAKTAAINVSFRKMSDQRFIAAALDERITEIVEAEAEGRRFYLAGRPHVKTRVYRGTLGDLRGLIPTSVVVVALLLGALLGTRRGVLLPVGFASVANLWTLAALVLFGVPLTILTGLLVPTLLAIGSVYGVHVLARYEEEAEGGGSPPEVALRSLRHLAKPVLISGATTVVGFAALLVSDVPAVVELGAFSMLGLAAITFLSLAGIGACLAIAPVPVRSTRTGLMWRGARRIEAHLDRGLAALAGATQRRAGRVRLVALVVAVAAVASIPRIVIDTDYLSYFDPEDPVRVEFEAVNRLLAGAVPLYVVLEGTGGSFFREPDHLLPVEALQADLDAVPGVSRTLSFLDPLRALNRAFHADAPEQEKVPDTRGGVTELVFMLPKADLTRYSTVNQGRINLVVRTGEVGSAATRRLEREIESVLERAELAPGTTATLTGNAILLAHSADGIARSQPLMVSLAAVAIFVLITASLGSVRLGLLAMVPNLIPVLVFFGLLGAGLAPLSLPTSLIGSVSLGVAIDDTVHFLVRYRDARARGASPEAAALECGRRIGRPIAITSFVLCLGFLVVTGSQFATLREFGGLAALTMGICLLTDLVLLPALLVRARI
ncbi:MAG: efflux RND transporter permease subunit [Proteobacteria bacterium]|nr:efflux RND transporter permease subunit [Pseudomonadota bacterium]